MVCGNTRWRKESCGGEVAECDLSEARRVNRAASGKKRKESQT